MNIGFQIYGDEFAGKLFRWAKSAVPNSAPNWMPTTPVSTVSPIAGKINTDTKRVT